MLPHPADAPLIGFGVQPEASFGADRLQQAVTPLPRPQYVAADAGPATQLADAQDRRVLGNSHG
jgi:hypothetical protein